MVAFSINSLSMVPTPIETVTTAEMFGCWRTNGSKGGKDTVGGKGGEITMQPTPI